MSLVRKVVCWFTFWQWLGAMVFWGIIFKLAVDVFEYDPVAHVAVFLLLISVIGAQVRGFLPDKC